jgi:hypothetical protein
VPGGMAHLARRRPGTAESARHSDSSGGEPWIAGWWLRTGRVSGRDSVGSGARSGGLSGRWRAVPIVLSRRASGTARGSQAAMARCQVGPPRHAASDRWDPLISVFRIKNPPDENSSK